MNNISKKWRTKHKNGCPKQSPLQISPNCSTRSQQYASTHCWMTRKISSQKGRSPIIFRFFGVLQDSEATIWVASVINTVYYMHEDVLKKNRIFRSPQSNGIWKIYSKSDQKGEFDWISLSNSACKFIPGLGYSNTDTYYDD